MWFKSATPFGLYLKATFSTIFGGSPTSLLALQGTVVHNSRLAGCVDKDNRVIIGLQINENFYSIVPILGNYKLK